MGGIDRQVLTSLLARRMERILRLDHLLSSYPKKSIMPSFLLYRIMRLGKVQSNNMAYPSPPSPKLMADLLTIPCDAATAGCCFQSSIFSSKLHPAIQDGKLKLCNLCSKHLKKHNPPFKCTLDQCGEAFRYKKDLIRHQGSKHHEIVRHLPIWYCSYSNCKFSRERGSGFARKDNYNRHIQTQHGGCVSGP